MHQEQYNSNKFIDIKENDDLNRKRLWSERG